MCFRVCDEHDLTNTGPNGFFNTVLNDWAVDEGKKFFW
ncbi:MAG: hypothetical protein CM1200mP25_2000 [Acidobacteriota bacterium]|nr:MAG: hypothetical protein CM1200mP25_2000 [Acidobacteriota bacterium]